MTRDRALDIIAAYGADARRWPDAERAGVLALAANDSVAANALGEAMALDPLLAAWASTDAGDVQFDADAVARPAPQVWRWLARGGLAAAAAAGITLLVVPQTAAVKPVQIAAVATTRITPATSVASSDATVFAAIFTTTPDEEELI